MIQFYNKSTQPLNFLSHPLDLFSDSATCIGLPKSTAKSLPPRGFVWCSCRNDFDATRWAEQ